MEVPPGVFLHEWLMDQSAALLKLGDGLDRRCLEISDVLQDTIEFTAKDKSRWLKKPQAKMNQGVGSEDGEGGENGEEGEDKKDGKSGIDKQEPKTDPTSTSLPTGPSNTKVRVYVATYNQPSPLPSNWIAVPELFKGVVDSRLKKIYLRVWQVLMGSHKEKSCKVVSDDLL